MTDEHAPAPSSPAGEDRHHAGNTDHRSAGGGVAPFAGRRELGRLWRLSLKELRETLRDRRTIITLLLMPILVYPLLSIIFQRFLLSEFRPGAELVFNIGIENEEDVAVIEAVLARGSQALEAKQPAEEDEDGAESNELELPQLDLASAAKRQKVRIKYFGAGGPTPEDPREPTLEEAVAQRRVDIGIRPRRVPDTGVTTAFGEPQDWELISAKGSPGSVLDYIERRVRAVNEQFVTLRFAELGVSTRETAVKTERTTVEDAVGSSTFSLAAVIPLILILMTITGAVYPAIDLTAGERERGTLEALIAAPVPRLGLLMAKYVAVLAVAILTATVNLVAMTATIYSVELGPLLFGERGLTLLDVLQVFSLLVLFAAFFSAVLLALTSFARSFKEAQAYLIPLMLFSLAPGILALVPGVRLSPLLAVVPLANVVLLARDVLQGEVAPLVGLVVVLATILYAAAALGLAARIFGTDAILYGSAGSWSDLFQRPEEEQSAASVSSALFCLAIMFPAQFLLIHLLGRFAGTSMQLRLGVQTVLAVAVFVGIPLIAADLNGVKWRSGFGLYRTSPAAFVGAALLGLSLWPFVYEIVLVAGRAVAVPLREEYMEWGARLIEELQRIHPAWILLTLAIVPAVVEEFFFRGYLFHALRRRSTAWRSIVYSAIAFGLFHVVVRDALAIERLLPSTLLGLVLGWVCERTGSVLPGMLLHACNNSAVLLIGRYRDELEARGWGAAEVEHLPASWLISAAVFVAVSLAILIYATRPAGNADERAAATGR